MSLFLGAQNSLRRLCEWLRFRRNRNQPTTATFEILESRLLLSAAVGWPFDFADTPDPYATSITRSGAFYIADDVSRFGKLIDTVSDALPDALALGDEADGLGDQDGVVFLTDPLEGQGVGSIDGRIDNTDVTSFVDLPTQITGLETLQGRLRNHILLDQSDTDGSLVSDYIRTQQPDGAWPDIRYTNDDRANWLPKLHLERLQAMAKAWTTVGHELYRDDTLGAAVKLAYGFWVENPWIESMNWWWNQVGALQSLSQAMILLKDDLSQAQIAQGTVILDRAFLNNRSGWNRISRADVIVNLGVITGDAKVVAESYAAISKEIKFAKAAAGIKVDYSFHQHAQQLYNGGYGIQFLWDTSRLGSAARGTMFALSDADVSLLTDFMLDGQQWMIRGRTFDPTTMGRYLLRVSSREDILLVLDAAKYLLDISTYRDFELRAMLERLERSVKDMGSPSDNNVEGNRSFWWSDFMSHHREGYYTSVRMISQRTVHPETVNYEGLKNRYLAAGVNLVMRTGEEYREIYPAWNWLRLPGTTVEQGPRPLLNDEFYDYGETTFVGSASDGRYGVSAMDYARDQVRAHKSWFFFDDEYVALGAGIEKVGGHPIITSMNQTLAKGEIVYRDENGVHDFQTGSFASDRLRWIHHDGIGYVVLDDSSRLVVQSIEQTGSWYEINRDGPADRISKNVFSLWIDHGVSPESATYTYVVAPGRDAASMDGYTSNLPLTVLRNDTRVQAVHHDGLGLTQVVFYEADSVSLPGGIQLSVSHPSILMVETRQGVLRITASNPLNAPLDLHVEVNVPVEGAAWDGISSSLTTVLPGGTHGGQSVTNDYVFAATQTGDVNRDGSVDNRDIVAFIDALISDRDEARFLSLRPAGQFEAADINMDDSVDNQDITSFVALLTQDTELLVDPFVDVLRQAAQHLMSTISTVPASRYPTATDPETGKWRTSGPGAWTSGFFPGQIWMMYDFMPNAAFLASAEQLTQGLEGQATRRTTHDLGFMLLNSAEHAYRITGNERYKNTLLTAATSLASRFNPVIGATRSWDFGRWEYPVIMDNMVNLELLFWASKHGEDPLQNQEWFDMAVSHADVTRDHHVRSDGSTHQIIDFDPTTGNEIRAGRHQGASVDSTWSRGQAWALYGFTMTYHETGEVRFLDTAKATADYFLDHLPDDHVPFWDFNAPGIPNEPKDSSAAAIAASGLIELALLVDSVELRDRYLGAAERILGSLSSTEYLAVGLDHHGIVLHGTGGRPQKKDVDVSLIYGDYYFIEALQKFLALPPDRATRTLHRTPIMPTKCHLCGGGSAYGEAIEVRALSSAVPAAWPQI